jgi:LPXTG-motif cell wall-anchored protein
VLRTRILTTLAGLGLALAGIGLTATPAQAVTFDKPAVKYWSTCDNTWVKIVPGNGGSTIRISVDGTPTIADVKLYDEKVYKLKPGTVVVEYLTLGLKDAKKPEWTPVGDPYVWTNPGNCTPPKVVTDVPDCADPDLWVRVKNPDTNTVPIFVRFNDGDVRTVAPGTDTVIKSRDDVKIFLGWSADPKKLDFHGKYKYVPPTACPTTPTPTTPPATTVPTTPPVTTGPSTPATRTTPPVIPVPGDSLPVTGASTGWLLTLGGAAVLAGAAAVILVRRRRVHFHTG